MVNQPTGPHSRPPAHIEIIHVKNGRIKLKQQAEEPQIVGSPERAAAPVTLKNMN